MPEWKPDFDADELENLRRLDEVDSEVEDEWTQRSNPLAVLTTEIVRENWPLDTPFDEELAAMIIADWKKMEINGRDRVVPFIRSRVPTSHQSQLDEQPESVQHGSAGHSVGPFSHGAGGGKRRVRKGNTMS